MILSDFVAALRRVAGRRRLRTLRSLHSVRRFRRVLALERARSDRSGERFSLLVFLPRANAPGQDIHLQLVRILRRRLRATDEAGWIDQERIGVVLPAAGAAGAWKVAEDVCERLGNLPKPLCKVYCYPSASAPDENARGNSKPRRDETPDSSERPVHGMEMLFASALPAWKRWCDIIGASAGLIVLSPLLLLVALIIKLASPGPVFFTQLRTGRGGRPFAIYKFRSMVVDAESKKAALMTLNEQDGPAFKIKSDPRITRFGRFIRSSSIDELPQLWNVLKGDMSLVGPRPLPCSEADACLVWQRRRLDITPGLTCIWQVRGRSRVGFNDWIRMDLEYARNLSPWQDFKILLATVPAVVLRRGAQ